MDIRNEIRKILMEELASLANPLDKAAQDVALSTVGFQDKVKGIADRNDRMRKGIQTDLDARKKAIMVPQSSNPAIERQRRQLDNMKIDDAEGLIKQSKETDDELSGLEQDLDGLSSNIKDLEGEREKLSNMISQLSFDPNAG